MLRILIAILICAPLSGHAQFSDSFSDGDMHANPTWLGDTAHFEINSAKQLHLSSSGTDSSVLYIPCTAVDSAEWSFWIKQSFSGSASNYTRVYLMSDQADLNGPLNGYFLQFGEALSNDAVELFRQSGMTKTSVCRAPDGQIAGSFSMGVKVRRSSNGYWRLYLDSLGGNQCVQVATGTDNVISTSHFFGLKTVYTSGNAGAFYFDDFYAGIIRYDHQPPALNSILALSSDSLLVSFSEPLTGLSANNVSAYSASEGLGHPLLALRDAADFTKVHLKFDHSFEPGRTYLLAVNGVADIENNVALGLQKAFQFYRPSINQVVFSELMVDVSPSQGLPECEYVELYNRSGHDVLLYGWKLAVGDVERTLPDIVFPASSYLIVTSLTCADSLSAYGTVLAVTSFPALTNTGNTIRLTDQQGRLMHVVAYSDSWYRDDDKSEGGYSLECIDVNNPCAGGDNWLASTADAGGTPGIMNSVASEHPDTAAPYLSRAYYISPYQVGLRFSEPMDSVALVDTSLYAFAPSLGQLGYVALDWPDMSGARLILTQPMQRGMVYRIGLKSGFQDCVGLALRETHPVYVAIPDTAEPRDVVINELLYNPKEDGVDFVEIFNASDKVLDLQSLWLGSANAGSDSLEDLRSISQQGYLFFPKEYKVLTSDVSRVRSHYRCADESEAMLEMAYLPSLSIEEDRCALLDDDKKVLDLVHYRDSWQFPLLNDTKGVSLERLRANRSSADSTNWHSAAETVGYATPGYRNSQNGAGEGDGSEVSVDPPLFSPDEDGRDDVAEIHYRFSDPGNVVRVMIYDLAGRLVRVLVNNELLGVEGVWTWDGICDDRSKADIGLYIIYVETYLINGQVKRFKRKLVLAGRL